MSRVWPTLRLAGGALVLAAIVWRFGTGPFGDAWRLTTWDAAVAALLLTAVATLANAWRWRVVARALGAPLTVSGSIAAYYRSQFLNATLPGGVVGDAHRAVRHGRDVGDLGVGLRAAVWDRVCGQVVQVGLLVVALAVLDTPLRRYAPVALGGLVAFGLLVAWLDGSRGSLRFVGQDLRILLRRRIATTVALASLASTSAHVAVFWVAMATVGVHASPWLAVSMALSVLVGSAVPLSVAGWGPREGITAGIFALAGLGSATGLTVSVVFGVLAAVATVPGVAVLLADAVVRRHRPPASAPVRSLAEARHG